MSRAAEGLEDVSTAGETESAGSESDGEGMLTVTGKKVVQQIVSSTSSAKDDSADIEIRGDLGKPEFTLPVLPLLGRVGRDESRDTSESEDGPLLAREGETVRDEGERERGLPLGFQRLVLQMKKRARSGLGVTIVHSIGKTKDLYMIRRIMAGGVAARDKRLKPGDRLVAINGKSLHDLSHSEVLQSINDAPKDIRLEIWRDPDFEFDSTSSIYSIGSRSSILSDEDNEDLSTKRTSLERVLSRERGVRRSPPIARYSASITDQLFGQGRPSPGTPKRWSAVILSPNVGPVGEVLPSPSPPPTSPTHTCHTPPNPLPSPTTLTPSPVPPSLSPSPGLSSHTPPASPPPSPPPHTLPSAQGSDHGDSDCSETPPLPASPPPPAPQTPIITAEPEQSDVFQKSEIERPKSLGPVPKGARLEDGPFEIEITKGIFGLGLTVGMGSVGMIVVQGLTSWSPIRKEGNIRSVSIVNVPAYYLV